MSENIHMTHLPTQKMNGVTNETRPVQQSVVTPTASVIPGMSVPASFKQMEKDQPSLGDLDIPQPTMYMTALPSTKKPKELGQALRTRCKQLAFSLFFQGQAPVRSLGFTSAIAGEGKTFLARVTAELMAEDNAFPVTLLECNWENPTLSSTYNLASGPGLSDWLAGQCQLSAIRRQVTNCLTVIPAGESTYNTTQLLRAFQQRGTHSVLVNPNEILIIDLPATVTTAYGPFAAQLADSLILVIRMGVTPDTFIVEARHYLKDLRVHGVIFNQVTSRIPHWLRRIL